jgi:predicted Zn-dependent protease
MLNNRLEDLIYQYKSYRLKNFIKKITALLTISTLMISLYVLYNKTSSMESKIKNKKKVKKNIVIRKISPVIKEMKKVKVEEKKLIKPKTVKPKTVKVKTVKVKKITLDEEKVLKENSLNILMILEKKKPTYQTALDLANYYFKNKDYQKASKWAIVATNRKPKKEKAWIIYAKSKIKLNQKGIAKKALKIYLLKYHSRKISILLNSI